MTHIVVSSRSIIERADYPHGMWLTRPMRRRDFITLVSGAAVAWPRDATAQNASKVYRVGSLNIAAPVADNSPFGAGLIRGLAQHGYALDRNLAFERRGAEMQMDRLPSLVNERSGDQLPPSSMTGRKTPKTEMRCAVRAAFARYALRHLHKPLVASPSGVVLAPRPAFGYYSQSAFLNLTGGI